MKPPRPTTDRRIAPHLFRLAEPAKRNVVRELLLHCSGFFVPLGDPVDHRPFDKGRTHGIAAHRRLVARAVQRDRFGQQRHAALGRVVGGEIVSADQAEHRRQIDDRAALLAQQRQRVFAAEKRAVEIDREHPAPGGEVGLLDAADRGDAGGVDQAVEPAVFCLDVGDDALPVGFGRDVERVSMPAGLQIAGDRRAAGAL